jgi:excinuclease ABC subunit A
MTAKKASSKKTTNKKNKTKKDKIFIKNARVNNLKSVSVEMPRDGMTVVTGLSGSGKSSLAFDVVYAESNRRFMESLSTHARSLMGVMNKPDVDKIENLSPAIAIDQKSVGKSVRSTVGTMTEIYDYLRILFTTIGIPHCPQTNKPLKRKSTRDIVSKIMKADQGAKILVLAPVSDEAKKDTDIIKGIKQSGYARVRFNGKLMPTGDAELIASDDVSSRIDIVVDSVVNEDDELDRECLMDSVETAMKLSGGLCIVVIDNVEEEFSQDFYCKESGFTLSELTPRCFSFNNPDGACSACDGLGVKNEINVSLLIPNDNLSIEEGAIHIWSKSGGKNTAFSKHKKELEKLAKKHKFSLSQPVRKISKEKLAIIFFGDGKEDDSDFKGIVYDLEERYKNTKSEYMRKELEKYMVERTCSVCEGKRLKREYLSVTVDGNSIDQFVDVPLCDFLTMMKSVKKMDGIGDVERMAVTLLADEMISRAKALCEVGVEYLTLSRSSNTLSGGEAQRIRLAVQIKSDLTGVIYVLDEPTTGLHSRDTVRLVRAMKKLQSANNTLIVVEHDAEIMKEADWVVDMGPGAGDEGGELVFAGTMPEMLKAKTKTAQYISGKLSVTTEKNKKREGVKKNISVKGARENNLKNIDVDFPLGKFVTVCGVSGSGKSTLVHDILSRVLAQKFHRATTEPGAHNRVTGLQNINKVIMIDQNPIGRTPRSNTATYTGVFAHVRDLFAQTDIAIERGFGASHFSFNMRGGRCEVCRGDGSVKVEMHLLPDMYVPCEACGGSRYNSKILDVEYNGVTIAEVLDMSVDYAYEFFKSKPLIASKLSAMQEVGLGYIQLGQSATNLSGGEAQRIKLATELARKSTGKTLYILDEPTVGLHFDDVKKLLKMLDALVDKGNTVLVVEHNTDVINHADWVIELGPDGGVNGGELIFAGLPKELKKNKKSPTAKFL